MVSKLRGTQCKDFMCSSDLTENPAETQYCDFKSYPNRDPESTLLENFLQHAPMQFSCQRTCIEHECRFMRMICTRTALCVLYFRLSLGFVGILQGHSGDSLLDSSSSGISSKSYLAWYAGFQKKNKRS